VRLLPPFFPPSVSHALSRRSGLSLNRFNPVRFPFYLTSSAPPDSPPQHLADREELSLEEQERYFQLSIALSQFVGSQELVSKAVGASGKGMMDLISRVRLPTSQFTRPLLTLCCLPDPSALLPPSSLLFSLFPVHLQFLLPHLPLRRLQPRRLHLPSHRPLQSHLLRPRPERRRRLPLLPFAFPAETYGGCCAEDN
jgi:hypothetical protein